MIISSHQSSSKKCACAYLIFFFSSLSLTKVSFKKKGVHCFGIISLSIVLTPSLPFHKGNNHKKVKYNFPRDLIINRELLQYDYKVGDDITYIFIKSIEK